jgi:hypothetical protein
MGGAMASHRPGGARPAWQAGRGPAIPPPIHGMRTQEKTLADLGW